jgi:Mrp family chromosome partitioning ATPase
MFEAVLDDLRARYDIVLIDSPPALILADAVSIAAKVDAVLWMVRAGTASRPYLARAAHLIRRSQMPFIGFVLNGVDSRFDPYYYGGYGYKRYEEYYGGENAADK